jgi:hypothetical protein
MILGSYMKTIGLVACILGFIAIGSAQHVWTSDTRLTYDDSTSYFGYPSHWAISADTFGRVHVVWFDTRGGFPSEVYYKRSTENGTTWGPDTPLTTGSSYWQETPSVATDHLGRVHVVYTEFESFYLQPIVHYKRSTDGGNSWGAQHNIQYLQGDWAFNSSLASDLGDCLYVLYTTQTGVLPGELDIYCERSLDGGANWYWTNRRLTTSQAALYGSVAADTLNRVHVVYVEGEIGARQLFYRKSIDSGSSFASAVQLTSANSDKFFTSICTDRTDMVHVAWEDYRHGDWEIYYIHSTDGGTTWGSETRLTVDSNSSREPNITADLKGGVYLVWTDNRPDEGVYFKYSTSNGNDWSNDTCLTNGAVAQYGQLFPNIACTEPGDYLHVAWQDYRDANREVYYKRGYDDVGIQENTQEAISSSLFRIFPNPFTTMTQINLGKVLAPKSKDIDSPGNGMFSDLCIYDAIGRLVREWDYVSIGQSDYIVWDGSDDTGRSLPAGIYFVQFKADDYGAIEKVILLR